MGTDDGGPGDVRPTPCVKSGLLGAERRLWWKWEDAVEDRKIAEEVLRELVGWENQCHVSWYEAHEALLVERDKMEQEASDD